MAPNKVTGISIKAKKAKKDPWSRQNYSRQHRKWYKKKPRNIEIDRSVRSGRVKARRLKIEAATAAKAAKAAASKSSSLPTTSPVKIEPEVMAESSGNIEENVSIDNTSEPEPKPVPDSSNSGSVNEDPSNSKPEQREADRPFSFETIKCIFCDEDIHCDEPRLLFCLHTVCSRCYGEKTNHSSDADIVETAITCPRCNVSTPFDDAVVNYFLQGKADHESPKTETVLKCTSCNFDGEVTSWCVECSDYLCDGCVQAHQRVKLSKDHTIKDKNEAKPDTSASGTMPSTLLCLVHKQERLNLFCETCDKLTCRDCQLQGHRDHKYKFINEMVGEVKLPMSELLHGARVKRKLIEEGVKVFEMRIEELKAKQLTVQKEIETALIRVINAAKARGRELIVHLSRACTEKQDKLQAGLNDLKQIMHQADMCITFVDNALNESCESALLACRKSLTVSLTRIKGVNSPVPRPHTPLRIGLDASDVDKIIADIETVGTVQKDDQPYPPRPRKPVIVPSTRTVTINPMQTQTGQLSQPYQLSVQQTTTNAVRPITVRQATPSQTRFHQPRIIAASQFVGQVPSTQQFPAQSSNATLLQTMVHPNRSQATSRPIPRALPLSVAARAMGTPQVSRVHLPPQNTQAVQTASGTAAVVANGALRHPISAHSLLRRSDGYTPKTQQQLVGYTQSPVVRVAQQAQHVYTQAQAQQRQLPTYVQSANQTHPTQQSQKIIIQSGRFPAILPQPSVRTQGQVQGQMQGQQQTQNAVVLQQVRSGQQHNMQQVNLIPQRLPYSAVVQQKHIQQSSQMRPQQQYNTWHIPQTNQTMQTPVSVSVGVGENFRIKLNRQQSGTAAVTAEPCVVVQQVSSSPVLSSSPGTIQSPDSVASTAQELPGNSSDVNVVDSSPSDTLTVDDACLTVTTEESTDDAAQKEDPNEDWCAVCMDGGDLICCDRCPKVYHAACHVPVLKDVPDETWQCLLCTSLDEILSITIPPGIKRCRGLDPRQRKVAERILLELYCQYEISLSFREMVSPQVEGYYQKIKKPMSLSKIKEKLDPCDTHHYTDISEMLADVRLIFKNAYTFNKIDDPVYKEALSLEDFFEALVRDYLPDLASNSEINNGDSEDDNSKRNRRC